MTTTDPADVFGTAEHAARFTQGRHPAVADALQWLTFAHLPESLRSYSRPFYQTAVELIISITDGPELTHALNGLIAAKDWAVRAGIRSDTGRAGSVPRPQTVINPPLIDNRIGPNFGRPIQDRPQA
jgi:hypothetical protein